MANKKKLTTKHFENTNFCYDDVQMSAIESASESGIKIITGPPGSGKTAVVNGIITYFTQFKSNAKIILCAPTGRAAKHMTEITGIKSSTIHKLLGISESSEFKNKDILDCDILICDESSMLNLEMASELFSRIDSQTAVYLIGDKDQLPAIGPGNVLHDIICSNVIPVFYLTKVYRQDGIILGNAHKVNQGIVPRDTSEQYVHNIYFDGETLREDAIRWFQNKYDSKEPFETQILVPSYKTLCGIISINEAIQAINQNDVIYMTQNVKYKKNDKILMIRNDPEGKYQNGTVGLFVANKGEEIVVNFDGEEQVLPKKAIDDMTLGYAVSVHKSQGSEYRHVLLCLPDEPANMLKRSITYTALTRAKQDVSVYEICGAFEKSIKTNPEIFSQTNLTEKIRCSKLP